MKQNMSLKDRFIRLFAAVIFLLLYFSGQAIGVIGNVLLVFSAVFVITGVLGNCPLYALFGVSSCGIANTK